jgi:hypothetical protein
MLKTLFRFSRIHLSPLSFPCVSMGDNSRAAVIAATAAAADAASRQTTLSGLQHHDGRNLQQTQGVAPPQQPPSQEAALPFWRQIRPDQPDGGLAHLLAQVGVPTKVSEYVTESDEKDGLGCESLRDFHGLTSLQYHNADLKGLLSRRSTLADKPIYHSRLKQAWVAADKFFTAQEKLDDEEDKPEVAPAAPPDNPEAPLGEHERAKLQHAWEANNGPKFLAELEPAAGLIGKASREWPRDRAAQMTR